MPFLSTFRCFNSIVFPIDFLIMVSWNFHPLTKVDFEIRIWGGYSRKYGRESKTGAKRITPDKFAD